MKFGLNEDQHGFRDAARELLQRLCPPSVVRAAWEVPPDAAIWTALAEMGVMDVLVPASNGGLGLDETYLVPVLVEAGAVALPHPLAVTSLVAAPLGVAGGDDDTPPVIATNLGGPLVASADFADLFLLVNPSEAPPGAAIEIRAFDRSHVQLAHVDTTDGSRRCARVTPIGPGTPVTDDPRQVGAAFDRGVLGAAAELVGLSRTMLELTVQYVTARHQFGKPIGSFQAVKHHLANARLQLEFAGPSVQYAAYALAGGLGDARRAVSQAKCLAGTAASVTGRAALQCHGAIGYTVESDLHLYLKRSWALHRSWGDQSFHTDRVAASIGL